MKKILILIAMALPVCATALSREEVMIKKYFQQPLSAKESKVAPGAKATIKNLYSSFFFVEEDTRLLQLVRVEMVGAVGKNLVIRAIRSGGLSYDNPISNGEAIIKIPDLREKAELELKLIDNGKEIQALKFDWTPAKQWKVYVSSVSHLDLGYTNTTENVFKKRNEITEMALEFMTRTDDWQEDAKYRWTMEGAWELKHFLEEHPERLDEIKKRAQEGRLEVCAKLVHQHTETEGYEELFRDVYYGKLTAEPLLGSSVLTMMHNDIDGITWGEVSVLASSGIKYFSFNPNFFYRGGNILHATKFPQAFYWQGPGTGELLTWRSKNAYTELPYGTFSSYLFEGSGKALEPVTQLLSGYEQEGYAYDAIHLTRSGADKNGANDNSWPRIEVCETIKEWNQQFAYPRLISATPKMFFSYLEKNFSAQIPKAKADMPDWWADGVITEAKWTAMSRDLHHLLYQTEAIASIASILDPSYQYPAKEINDAYYNNILFDEHTWGYLLNTSPQHKQIFNVKSAWLNDAHSKTHETLNTAQNFLIGKIASKDPSIIVFNPLSWQRSDLIKVDIESSQFRSLIKSNNFILIDSEKQDEVPIQITGPEGKQSAYFIAKNISPLGYKRYDLKEIETSHEYPANLSADAAFLENEYYRLEFYPLSLGLRSIYDKNLQKNLLDEDRTPIAMGGEYIFRKQDIFDLSDKRQEGLIESWHYFKSPVFVAAVLDLKDPRNPKCKLTQKIFVYDGLDYIDITTKLENYKNKSNESRYLAFPFNVPDFEIWVETPYGKMRPYYDQLPDFAKFYAVSHNVELRSKGEGFTIVWSTKEAPMIELGEITKKAAYYTQMIRPFLYRVGVYPWNPDKPTIYSEIMNNFQNTNFSPSQKGDMTFHYRITAIDNKDLDKAHRSGWELAVPAIAVVAENGTAELPPMGSFATVSPDNVMITAFKRAEDGDGYIVRLYEAAGKITQARLEFPLFHLKEAFLTDGVERVREKMEIKHNGIELGLTPFQVKTIKLEIIK